MLHIQHLEGRLVLVKVVSPVTLSEINQGDMDMKAAELKAGGKVLICADYRETKLLNVAEAEALLAMFREHNDKIERSAILVSEESAMAVLQMSRVIKQANLPTRRSFKDTDELLAWLDEVSTETERQSLHRALGE
jgi:hypothetical protein